MKTQQERITELEISLAHLQRQYDVLNEVVTEQTSRLDRVVKQIARWEQRLDRLKHAVETESDPLDEKPPHY